MLLKPLITEKSLSASAHKRYGFLVELKDSKTDIKNLVEKHFKVTVLKVQTSRLAGKSYRTGRRGLKATRTDVKKAFVQIKPDQKIELFATPEAK